ncbi:MAG TPA: universal stress protein [Saprospiraceae bacterium]|nr:universal stress protein [Saprospiraceae bacterium]
MKHIQKIIVPTDFSESSSRAFSYALWFADRVGASIDLLHIVYPGTDVMDFPAMAAQVTKVQVETAQQVMQAFTNEALTRLQSTTDFEHVPVVRPRVDVGTPATLVSALAKELESDLVVMGTRGEHNRLEVAFGSVTTAILKRSPVPVLVVPSELDAIQIKTLGYATSLDESDPYHIWQAAQMLSPFNAFLKIVHVRTSFDDKKNIDLPALETFLAGKDLALQVSFHESTDTDIEEGLENFVSLHKVDLLIMYSPKRNVFERIGHRSLTRKMALFSHIPILVMK